MQFFLWKPWYTPIQKLDFFKYIYIYIYFLKKAILLFSKDALNLSKVTIYTSFLNYNIYRMVEYHGFHKNIKQQKLFSTFIIRNVSWAANHHIRLISEGSCDTEDWRNDAENSALITEINYILKCIMIKLLNCNDFSHIPVYCICDHQISSTLIGEHKRLGIIKNRNFPNFWLCSWSIWHISYSFQHQQSL